MSIVSNFLPLSSVDIVAILDANGDQILVGDTPKSDTFGFSTGSFLGGQIKAQPMKAYINRDSKGFTHPLENNKNLTDHRIILPIEIQMKLIISRDKTSQIYKELEYYFQTALPVQVKTKADTFDNLYISAIPHGETPEKFNSLEVDVRISEIQLSSNITNFPNEFAPGIDEQQDTVDRGELNVQAA